MPHQSLALPLTGLVLGKIKVTGKDLKTGVGGTPGTHLGTWEGLVLLQFYRQLHVPRAAPNLQGGCWGFFLEGVQRGAQRWRDRAGCDGEGVRGERQKGHTCVGSSSKCRRTPASCSILWRKAGGWCTSTGGACPGSRTASSQYSSLGAKVSSGPGHSGRNPP